MSASHMEDDRKHLRRRSLTQLKKIRGNVQRSIDELQLFLSAIDDVIAEKEQEG